MNKDLLLQQLSTHQMMLLYFKGSQCSACLALLPKVENFITLWRLFRSRYDSIHRGERIYQRSGNF